MDNEFIIFEYLDGEMNPQQEEAFFNLLAQNEELRTEFKHQLALKNSFVSDLRNYAPEPKSTLGVFTKLGISATALTAASNTIGTGGTTSFISSISSFLTGTVIKSILATLAVSGITFFGLIKSNIIEIKNDENIESNFTSTIYESKLENNSEFEEVTQIQDDARNLSDNILDNQLVNSKQIIYQNNYIFTFDTLKLEGEEKIKAIKFLNSVNEFEKAIAINQIKPIEYSYIEKNNYFHFDQKQIVNSNGFNTIKNNNIELLGNTTNVNLPLTFEINYGQFNNSLVQEREINRQYSFLNNVKMNLLYRFSDELSAGLNYSNETYYQTFNITAENGRRLEYYQKPEFNVISAALRYTPNFLKFGMSFVGIEPIIQASYGADFNGGGYVSRANSGVNIYLSNKVYLQLLGEYSNLNFKQGETKYNTDRIGVNFGVGIKFGE
jgi:hypothetical protein